MPTLYWLLIVLPVVLATFMAGHALLHKRDPRAALGWVVVCVMFPLAGPIFYGLFGINRVRRSAARLRDEATLRRKGTSSPLHGGKESDSPPGSIKEHQTPPQFRYLEKVGRHVTKRLLIRGNTVIPLHNGEMTYPKMLQAIQDAKSSIFLTTYILETGHIGRTFITALAEAQSRGVDVRVIIDGIGEKYSWPRASQLLKKANIPVTVFLPPRLLPPQLSINLRNHRKVLVIDGQTSFTGGMNIGKRHLADSQLRTRVTDLHFSITGPITAQLQEAFLSDWDFVTGKYTPLPETTQQHGTTLCRMIMDGPDTPEDPLSSILLGVISAARQSIYIMTPYFLPSREMLAVLNAAAIRGVDVRIYLPARSNLPVVHWATRNLLWELLQQGVRIFYQPPPFCHTKLCILDDRYIHLGSANIDPRSLRLNFELTLEVFDTQLAQKLAAHCKQIQQDSHEITLEEVDSRSMPERIRDAFCWLFSPYL